MMRCQFKGIIVVAFFLLLSACPAFAHETKYVDSLSILLHMEPQDSPVIKMPAQLYFAFTDSENAFNLKTCDCSVSVLLKGDQLFGSKLASAEESFGPNVGFAEFAFPRRGVYQVVLKANTYEVIYDVRVERKSLNQEPVNSVINKKNSGMYILILGIGLTAVILITEFLYPKIKRKSP